MEALPCANEVAQLQQHLHQQAPPPTHSHSPVSAVSLNDSSSSHIHNMNAALAENVNNVVNIPKELILISLVSQEQALYNPKHQHYRSTQRKDHKWSEIGSHIGWTDIQCKGKWKAMRDQYCRELKRSKASPKNNVKWKYFKELEFLRPFALARNYRTRNPQNSNGITSNASSTLPNVNSNNNSFSNSNSSSQTLGMPNGNGNKIEDASASILSNCNFVPSTTATGSVDATTVVTVADKKNDSTRLISAFMSGQMSNVLEQQQQTQPDTTNWNYLTHTAANVTNGNQVARETANISADDTLYNNLVDCVNAAVGNDTSTLHQTADGTTDDDTAVHTYFNLESYFEKELIALIQNQSMIYNYSDENYRNVKLKQHVWTTISETLKKPVKQCRQKWKALRDQYAREYKRLKSMKCVEAHSRWKHYDSLGFLQKYIQQKTSDNEGQLNLQQPKHEPVGDLDDHMGSNSPDHTLTTSPAQSAQLNEIPALPILSSPDKAELSHSQPDDELCVASYDEMDIENYITGDVVHDVVHDDEEDGDDEDMEAPTEQHVVQYQNKDHVYIAVHTVGNALANDGTANKSVSQQSLNDGSVSSLEQHQSQQHQQQLHNSTEFSLKMEVQTPTSTNGRFQTPNANTSNTASSISSNNNNSNMGNIGNLGNNSNQAAMFASSASDDDEIGAFFKAIAMKIRNAQLEPVTFTDLQIDILRVINDALRHH